VAGCYSVMNSVFCSRGCHKVVTVGLIVTVLKLFLLILS
jgi:hypothetical protein